MMLQRKRLFVDRAVQGAILRRACVYWTACLLFITLPVVIGRTVAAPGRLAVEHAADVGLQFGPVLACAALVLPVALYDLLKLTNRVVGPILRLRRALRRLADGESVESVRFREGDFWPELAADLSRVAERLRGQAAPAAKAE